MKSVVDRMKNLSNFLVGLPALTGPGPVRARFCSSVRTFPQTATRWRCSITALHGASVWFSFMNSYWSPRRPNKTSTCCFTCYYGLDQWSSDQNQNQNQISFITKPIKSTLVSPFCVFLTRFIPENNPSLSSSSMWRKQTFSGKFVCFQVMEANLNGDMNLKIQTDLVSVTTHFKDLGNPDGGPTQSRDPEVMAEVTVDIRKLLQFLMGQQVNPSKALCNIVHQNVVHLVLLHEDVSLQYFIPAVS
uniref:HUS1 checkpoint clamp component n=1 Tax=Poecilia reticulata TaxID=8081 RepID=A0A3P9P0M4_POERE